MLKLMCPDRELEEAEENGNAMKVMPADQGSITDYLGSSTFENDGRGNLCLCQIFRK